MLGAAFEALGDGLVWRLAPGAAGLPLPAPALGPCVPGWVRLPGCCGSGEPGRWLAGGSLGPGTSAVSEERTAPPSSEPTSRVTPVTKAAMVPPRRSTRLRRSHSSERGPSLRHASPASRPSIE